MAKKKTPRKGGAQCTNKQANFADVSTNAQQQRLLKRLEKGPITTLEARRHLDILAPAVRVKELREMGYRIETVWTRQTTLPGVFHRIARYVLRTKRGQA